MRVDGDIVDLENFMRLAGAEGLAEISQHAPQSQCMHQQK